MWRKLRLELFRLVHIVVAEFAQRLLDRPIMGQPGL